ncbi:MAG TPA: ricin-type beta-trefoil lectin domain protein [Streptosporangiaceae bacterium]|nr:ricin-type beta-trefoil lectin domain protein [Streptosporangiaceae bacterium]
MRFSRIAIAFLAAASTTIALTAADASSPQLTNLVGQGPVAFTPNVSAGPTVGQSACNSNWFGSGGNSCQSEVYDTAYVNGDVVVVGAFTQACQPGTLAQGLCKPGTQVTRNDIFAYQAGTGLIDPNFTPQLDKGPAWTVIPGPAGSNTVFVGGSFTSVNGTTRKGIVQLHVNPGVTTGSDADGAIVTGFKANVSNMVRDLALSPDGTALYAGGQFTTVNSVAETALVRVNAKTGAVDPSFHITLTSPVSGDPIKVEAMDLTANGSLLAFSGSALQVNGQSRPRLAIVATGGTLGSTASLTDFTAPILTNACSVQHDYVRALSFAPDGSYLVIADTGFENDGSMPFSPCDSVVRFNVGAAGSTTTGTPVSVNPSWIDFSGGDSFYSVVVAGGVVYTGGHNRWVNNYCGQDNLCEENAEYVGGLAALDASTGVGLDWWHPITLRGAGTMYLDTFGAGTYDTTHSGLAIGMDDDVIAGAYHAEESLLPGGPVTTKTPFGPIPSGLFANEDGASTSAPMCLDDPGNSSVAGTAIDLANCLNTHQQDWTVPAVGKTGQIQINGLCLDTAAGGTSGGTGVVLSACSSSAATQQWSQGAGRTLINQGATTAQGNPMCLDDPGSATTSGTALDLATCSGGANQIWPLPSAPGPAAGPPSGPIFPQLLSTTSEQPCLDDASDSTAAGNKIQVWTCRGDAAQNWLVEPGGTIQLGASSCLDTTGGHTDGTKVVLEPCSGTSSQIWTHGSNDSLVQQSTGMCLDINGGTATNGTAMQIWTCNGGTNQAWRLPGW